jgi:hypothetical protein
MEIRMANLHNMINLKKKARDKITRQVALVACIQSHRNPLQSIDRAPQQPLD